MATHSSPLGHIGQAKPVIRDIIDNGEAFDCFRDINRSVETAMLSRNSGQTESSSSKSTNEILIDICSQERTEEFIISKMDYRFSKDTVLYRLACLESKGVLRKEVRKGRNYWGQAQMQGA